MHGDWQFLIITRFKFTEVSGDFNVETLLILDPRGTKTSVRSLIVRNQLQRVIGLKCRSFA